MAVTVGIDLGTTFSVVARVLQEGPSMVIPNSEGLPITPSVVMFDGNTAVVGSVAKEAIASSPETVVQLIKRHMGSDWFYDHKGVSLHPEHVSALIIKKLIQDASLLVGPIEQGVITVPAYFNDAMRLATRRAGELAGLEVLGLVSEPTAAAISFGYDQRPQEMTGMVFDLGGGTFDVTVMDMDHGHLTVKATGGDPYLGGANFDKALFDYFVERFSDHTGLDISDFDVLPIDIFAQTSQDWLARATRAKLDLTALHRTTVVLQAAGRSMRLEVTRETFESLISVLLDEMVDKAASVIREGGVSPGDVDHVIAVGGSTRVPAVRKRLEQLLGRAPETASRPDEAVAQGAALFAASRQMEQGDPVVLSRDARQYLESFSVTDVAAHSLGVLAYDRPRAQGGRGLNSVVLPRNTALPFEDSRTFYTAHPGETSVTVQVLEGDDPDPALCSTIAEVQVSGLPPNRPATQPVTVTMRYNRDGILEVMARDDNSGVETTATIERTERRYDDRDAADQLVKSMEVI